MAFTDPESIPRTALLAVAAAVLLAAAAFLPWSVEAGESFGGLHEAVQDGYLVLAIAVAVVAVAIAREWDRAARVVAALGGLAALVLFYRWHDPIAARPGAEPGTGLFLVALGGVGLLAAAVLARSGAEQSDADRDVVASGTERDADDASQ